MDKQKFYSVCMQGNVLDAIQYLKAFNDKSIEDLMLEKQYEECFFNPNYNHEIDSEDSWIKDVLNCYYSYFRSVLTNNSIEEAEKLLIIRLLKQLTISENSDIDEIEEELENIFKEKGYSFLGGITSPYRGPYIWKTTKKKDFDVSLPGGEQKVNNYLINIFSLFFLLVFSYFPYNPCIWYKNT